MKELTKALVFSVALILIFASVTYVLPQMKGEAREALARAHFRAFCRSFVDRAARTAFFAQVDLLVNVLTLGTQLFLTARTVRLLGVALTLTLLPIFSVFGFVTLGLAPTVAIIVVFQVLRRAGNFAVARPTREVLFTVIPREDKYKAKSFIDTVVYRSGDQIGAWSYALLSFLGLGMSGMAFAAVPISAVWLLNGFWLGRQQEAMAAEQERFSRIPVSLEK